MGLERKIDPDLATNTRIHALQVLYHTSKSHTISFSCYRTTRKRPPSRCTRQLKRYNHRNSCKPQQSYKQRIQTP